MSKFKFAFQAFALVGLFFAFSVAADAQATRTWVSGVGDDVNPCSRTAPCKTFAGAISKTATNGEINCLDPGGYGAVTITKSITIDCEDTQGSILASLVNGVIINSSTANVRLRGISINGAGNGINGIRILAASKVFLEEVVIDNFSQHGISVETSSGALKLAVDNCTFRNNTGNGINTFLSGTASAVVAVSDSGFFGNNIGYNLGNAVKATINDSDVVGNTTGILATGATLGVSSCNVSLNTTGVQVGTGGSIRISDNMITGNGTGLSLTGGGSIISYDNNVVEGNTTDGAPSSFSNLN